MHADFPVRVCDMDMCIGCSIYFCISGVPDQDKAKEWLAFLTERGANGTGGINRPILLKTAVHVQTAVGYVSTVCRFACMLNHPRGLQGRSFSR